MEQVTTEEHWDEIIEPTGKLLDLRLKEVWKYRDLLLLFVKRDFAAQYKQTILGPIWHLIQPILQQLFFYWFFTALPILPQTE